MKKFILSLITIVLLSAFVTPAISQDVYNWNVKWDTTKSYDNWDAGFLYLNYGGSLNWADVGDSSYNIHTKPMLTGNANAIDGYLTVNAISGYGAASDYQIKIHYSNDLQTWTTAAAIDGDLDEDADQVDADTLGQINGSNDVLFHSFKWMVLEFDGQTANIENQVILWSVGLKLQEPVMVNGNPVYSLGGVAQPTSIKANP